MVTLDKLTRHFGSMRRHHLIGMASPTMGSTTARGKPFAIAYIDDRGLSCHPQDHGEDAFEKAIENAKLLNAKEPPVGE